MRALLRSFWRIVRGIMREVADESAYERHLAFHGTSHSPEEYRRFAEHRLRAKYMRAKCC